MPVNKDAADRIIAHVKAHPGATVADVRAALPDLAPSTVRRQCWELERAGLFELSTSRGVARDGRVSRLNRYTYVNGSRPPA